MSCPVRLKNNEKYGTSTHLGRSSTKVLTFYSTWTSTLQQIEGGLDQFFAPPFHTKLKLTAILHLKMGLVPKGNDPYSNHPMFQVPLLMVQKSHSQPPFGWCCLTRRLFMGFQLPNVAGILLSYVSMLLVGGFNPSQKYDRQNGNLPWIGVKIPKIFETTT